MTTTININSALVVSSTHIDNGTSGNLLRNIDDTLEEVAPIDLPISTATQAEIDARVIISNPSVNSIAVNDSDLIVANNSTQPNTITGTSSLRGIFSGYDNTIGANLASNIIGSHHSTIKDNANHALISGGSTNELSGNSSYAVILAGKDNEMNAPRSALVACENNSVLNGDNGFVGAIACNNMTIGAGVGSYIFAGSSTGSIFLGADTHKSIVGGNGNSVSGGYVFIGQGQTNLVQGNRASVLNGSNNQAKQNEALVLGGQTNVAQGVKSTVINGLGCTAYSYNEVVFGNYPTVYTPTTVGSQTLTDRALTVGNGTGTGSRSDALVLLKNGNLTTSQYNLKSLNTAPASATDTGVLGEIRVTSDHIYICVATNTWKRTPLATW